MRSRRDFLLPLVTGLAIFSMSVFISCASQSRIDEDGNEIEETSVSESGDDLGNVGSGSSADNLGDLPPSENQVAEAPPPPADDLSADAPPSDAPPPGDLPPDGLSDAPPSGDLADLPPADELPPAGDLPPPGDLPPAGDLPPVADGVRGAAPAGIPKIPANAVTRAGTPLNRFYFVRPGDTKESVSQLIYGDTSRAADLGKWNKGGFNAGKLVFYQSPQQPDDQEMKPLYQEKGITPVDYEVQKGDTLGSIAKSRLGSGANWKEIAVVNGLDRPEALEVGQKIALYPVNGDASQMMAGNDLPPQEEAPKEKKRRGKKEEQAQNDAPPPVDVPPPAASNDAPLVQAEATPAGEIPPPVPAESVPADTFKKKKKSSGGFSVLRLLEQNLFFIILGLGVAVLGGALFFVNKRRKAKAAEAEFGDDAFASPKAKRR